MTFEMPRFRERARCAETDPDCFFPEKGGKSKPAKTICNGDEERPPCRAREECLAWALTHREAGIWGGLSERERKRLTGHRDECGSTRGYKMHVRRREAICDLCREANASYSRNYRAERRGVA